MEDLCDDISDNIHRIRKAGADKLASDFVTAFTEERSVPAASLHPHKKRKVHPGRPTSSLSTFLTCMAPNCTSVAKVNHTSLHARGLGK